MSEEQQAQEEAQEKWVYQHSSEKKKEGPSLGEFIVGIFASIFYLVLFTLLPVLLFIAVDWLVYFVTKETFYREMWVKPLVLVLATFLSGAYIRQVMEESFKTMGVFLIGIFGLIIFSTITWMMLNDPGSLYAVWLPTVPTIDPAVVFALPFSGLIGMFCFKFFSLRHFI